MKKKIVDLWLQRQILNILSNQKSVKWSHKTVIITELSEQSQKFNSQTHEFKSVSFHFVVTSLSEKKNNDWSIKVN